MARLIFATGNKGKLTEARVILGQEVKGTALEIDEVQSLDPVEVAVKKARAYFIVLKKPLFVEDGSVFIKALGNLPGPYIDSFSRALGNQGIADLLKNKKDKSAVAVVNVVYVNKSGKEHIFEGKVTGKIADKPRGDKGFGWDPIFIPTGSTKTFGQMELTEKNKYSMRKKALLKFKKWLKEEASY